MPVAGLAAGELFPIFFLFFPCLSSRKTCWGTGSEKLAQGILGTMTLAWLGVPSLQVMDVGAWHGSRHGAQPRRSLGALRVLWDGHVGAQAVLLASCLGLFPLWSLAEIKFLPQKGRRSRHPGSGAHP